jgi:zinc transport system permease protein
MLQELTEIFGYPFFARAALAGVLISLCASLLGVSLVLKRYSMIGDGLSHVGFGALAVAAFMNVAPMTVALPVVVAAAFLLLRLGNSARIKGDAAIGLISIGSLSIGVLVLSLGKGVNTDLESYLFGSILAMSRSDVILSVLLAISVLTLYILFYNRIFAATFDETFARAGGVKTGASNMLTALLTAVTITLGMRIMGAMLISGLLIFPALTAMRLFQTFRSVTIAAALTAVGCFVLGLSASFWLSLPPGASVIAANIVAFFFFWGFGALPRRLN